MMYDYNKYKRVFAFGCSFTGYRYPTWANIMGKHVSQAEFFNLGRSGGGNVFIANRITEANRYFKFCETDLVMVMWSTFCREDRYRAGPGWVTPGNIYSQSEYDFTNGKYLATWGNPLTYLVRDLSVIEMTDTFLNSLPCDSLKLLSVPFSHQQELNDSKTNYLLELYQSLEDRFPNNLFDLEMNGHWDHGSKYIESWTAPNYHEDYHPSTLRYANYLKKIGIELSDEAMQYAIDSNNALQQINHYTEFEQVFPNIDPRTVPSELL